MVLEIERRDSLDAWPSLPGMAEYQQQFGGIMADANLTVAQKRERLAAALAAVHRVPGHTVYLTRPDRERIATNVAADLNNRLAAMQSGNPFVETRSVDECPSEGEAGGGVRLRGCRRIRGAAGAGGRRAGGQPVHRLSGGAGGRRRSGRVRGAVLSFPITAGNGNGSGQMFTSTWTGRAAGLPLHNCRFLQLHDVVRRAPRQREDRPRRILVRLRDERPAVGDEQILHVVRLAVRVEHRRLRVVAHARAAELVDDRAAGRDAVALLLRRHRRERPARPSRRSARGRSPACASPGCTRSRVHFQWKRSTGMPNWSTTVGIDLAVAVVVRDHLAAAGEADRRAVVAAIVVLELRAVAAAGRDSAGCRP